MSTLRFMMITADPEIAAYVECHGVSRIFLDQETLGKAERQGHLDTHKAAHTLRQVLEVASAVRQAEVMLRLNPLYSGTATEVDAAIAHGARRLMLPMFRCRAEVARFLELVAGRVPVSLLAETPQALVRLPDWLPLLTPGRDEVHFGLNDLSLGLGLDFLFEPLAGRLLDGAAQELNRAGIVWGVGGIARVGEGRLPCEWVVSEHVRLGSRWAILSRSFHGGAATLRALRSTMDLPSDVQAVRRIEQRWRQATAAELDANQRLLARCVYELCRGKQDDTATGDSPHTLPPESRHPQAAP